MFKDENRHYSLRKLSVGLASVLIGISFVSGNGHTVKADTVKDGSNSAQTVVQTTADDSNTVVKDHDATAEANAKDDANAVAKVNAESTLEEQSQTPEAVKKNSDTIIQDSRQNAVKASEAAINVQDNTVKDNGDETTLNAKGSKAIAANMPKEDKTEVKENQGWTDPVKNKLQMSTVRSTTSKRLNAKLLAVSKAVSQANDTNGGFDSSWGKLDVNDWKGSVQGDYYQLTDYTGDVNHIIVPNEADFVKAGISTSGKQVGVTSDLMHTIFRDKTTAQDATVAFSKTDNKQVKAIGDYWSNTWGHAGDYVNGSQTWSKGKLTKFDGSNLDVANVTNMNRMFGDNQISDLNPLANWKVEKVTDMGDMFNGNQISDLRPLADWNVNNVTNMSYMFDDNQISDLSPLANWKVNNVARMGGMFDDNQISDLNPLSNWNVNNVTDMSYMFHYNQISDLRPLANWNVNNVTDMNNMFYHNQISDLSPLANWNVNNVTDMSYMFHYNQISDLRPLANWNVNNVTDMNNMFYHNHISDLNPLANWKVDKITDMFGMFSFNQISDLSPLSNWNVNNVTNMSYMFDGNQISNLSPLSNWNVNNVINMSYMFDDNQISNLSPLSNWNVNNVINMSYMFHYNQISDLRPLANWNVNNVTDMNNMFYHNHISDLNPLANWKVDKITDMSGMFSFNQISNLSPLSNWNVNNVTNMRNMFDDNVTTQTKTIQAKRVINFVYPDGYTGKKQDSVTQTVDVPQKVNVRLITKDSKPSNNILDWATKKEIPEDPDPVYFQDYTVPEIKGLLESDQTVISRQQADINKPINVTVTYKLVDSNTNDAFALDSKNGLHEHANVNDNGGYDADFWGKINVNNWNYTVNGDRIEIIGLKYGVSTGANDAVIVPNLDDFKLAGKDGGAKSVYISKKALGEINVLGNSTAHKYYGLSKTNGGKFVTDSDLNNAFNNSNLTHADLNSLDTGNVTDMRQMFMNASGLNSLDVSNWKTSNVTNMESMFDGANSLTSLDVSKWKTGNVTDMNLMFSGASNLTSLDVSKWDTSKVIDMSDMFNSASSLTTLGVSKWDTGNVTDMSRMFAGASSLNSLDVSKWDTSKVIYMSGMFAGASSLNSLDVSKWDTSKVIDMSDMFNSASSLTSLDVSKWNTGNVTNMSWMFNAASSLALIVNGDKFADYLVKNNFADSNINSNVKSVTTDNTKLLQLLTNDVQHNSATRTIVFTFPTGYSPDLTKYHLTKTGNTYQIKQSADYDTSYAQGTVLINATDDITKHHIDTTKPYKLSDTWKPNYDTLVLAHKNADGTVSFDKVQLPKVPGYKAKITRNNGLLLVNYLVFAPEKPATNNNLNELQFSNKLTTNSTVKPNIVVKSDMYQVANDNHNWQLPVIKSYDLKFATNKNQIIFAYTKDKQYNYRFVLTFKDGQYRLTTFDKPGKLLKTYSIESYKKLAEIIHSLVPMNIA